MSNALFVRLSLASASLVALAACANAPARGPSSQPIQSDLVSPSMHINDPAGGGQSDMGVSHMNMGVGSDGTAACDAVGWSNDVTDKQQQVIDAMMGERKHRLHHALWHSVRGGLTSKERKTVSKTFGPTWSQAHGLCPAPAIDPNAADYNPAGEDFLFMHHEMVEMLRSSLVAAGQPCIRPWETIPSAEQAPLPDDDTSGPKSKFALAKLKMWEEFFLDANWLRKHSLSQVGWALEFTIHNNLHMRYATSAPPKGFEELAEIDGAPIPLNGVFVSDWKYDAPSYNWLADPYSAALNPTFWKIHGYVDRILEMWLRANNYERVSVDCSGEAKCYQWRGTWVGVVAASEWKKAGTRAVASVGGPVDGPTATFTAKRMQFQKLGVIQDVPPKGSAGGIGTDGPQDPFETMVPLICPH